MSPGDLRDASRLSFGMFTIFPVRPPTRVDRAVAGAAMIMAPAAGAALAAAVLVPLLLALEIASVRDSVLLVALLVTGALALLTRGMHMDGLADTADGLGSGRQGPDAVAIMHQSDIGPFGVITLVVALGIQVAALADLALNGTTTMAAALVLALVVSRGLIPVLCGNWMPAAAESGLGKIVAGSVRPLAATGSLLLSAMLVAAGLGLLHLLATVPSAVPAGLGPLDTSLVRILAIGLLGVVPALVVAVRSRARFEGVTGDVYGASVETAYTAILLFCALAA
ncbi:adenosylcobinamide-GDP ribazoletransferase [Nocardioides sp. AE5]|uniref:adenosylcobinamide-GDP ribazoletransferase n=1 Tax=Nocardioides sp. AE5 TaxID=2962573 RepID=UPI0028828966|nr:adenosylcobinamide-GDP ribazoletransferase [Nocardioides sp. AE5]MDT0201759.1 adenosylcobinamide-GDP ribazoletransferase [Nocardioides sp. AE5]